MSGTFFTVASLARELNLSEKTIRRSLKAGSLKSYRIGRVYRISFADAQAWISAGRFAAE